MINITQIANSTIVRFVIAGALTNVVYAVAMLITRSAGAEWWLAAAVAYLVSLLVNYGLQSRYTFKSNNSHATHGWKYLTAQGGCLAVNAMIVQFVAGQLHWHPLIAQGCSVLATLVISYFLMSRWVFAQRGRSPTASAAQEG